MTDSVPLPRVSSGVTFNIPLWIPPRLDDATQITLKLFIHSQASLMLSTTGKGKSKHYTIGQTQLSVGQMRQILLQQRKGFFSLTLASSLVADGQLQICVLPDLKLPALGQRGWSLTDPRFSGFASRLFNVTLDQSYCLNPTPTSDQWLIATERATESTLTLPVAAALANIYAQACQVSVNHARATSVHLLSKRTEQKGPGTCARVHLTVQCLQLDDVTATNQLSSATMALAWQPPDSIFELELMPATSIPIGQSSSTTQHQAHNSLQFFPPACTSGILPAIWKAYGGKLPPTGYLLGNLRMQFSLPNNKQGQDLWEAVIVLEQHVRHPQNNTTNTNTNTNNNQMQFPVYSLWSGHKVGSILLSLSVELENQTSPVPPPISPCHGLVALVGLTSLMDGVLPSLDFENFTVQQNSTHNPQRTEEEMRRNHQLATMGTFISYSYMEKHIQSRREADLELFQHRAQVYNSFLLRQGNDQNNTNTICEPSWQDMTPRPFRPSSSRLEISLSGIPFNTHNASWSLDSISPEDSHPQPDGALFHNVTCGAPADHARGFGNIFTDKSFTSPVGSVSGGLRRLEAKRYDLANVVNLAQKELISAVSSYFQNARQQQKYINHVPARHATLQNLRWKVFEAVHAYHHVTWICAVRRANAFSQALGIALTSYFASLSDVAKCQLGWPELWVRHGYLVSFEGLLSAAGKELGMIEDASVAIDMLHMVRIVLVPDDENNKNADPSRVAIAHSPLLRWIKILPSLNGTETQYLVQVGIHSHFYDQRIPQCLKNGATVHFFPVLFQVGVDIRQWGAHAGSNMKNQFSSDVKDGNSSASGGGLLDDEDDDVGVPDDDVLVALNYEALRKMNVYAHKISPIQGVSPNGPVDDMLHCRPPSEEAQISRQQANNMSVHPSLAMLHGHIMTSMGKMNHSILDEAATMAQQLGGGGVVFCKSGKDRTAMHVTYKQAQFANRFRQQRNKTEQISDSTLEDATRMRIYGTRLPICEKNVGQALYAFNSLQSKFMPDALKPPPSTLAGFLKGGRVFGKGGIES